MQRIIVIPDSFKGALSSREAGSAIATGLASVTDTEVLVVPIADGGEGTVEAAPTRLCGQFHGCVGAIVAGSGGHPDGVCHGDVSRGEGRGRAGPGPHHVGA